jgi:DNA-binding IclR family transcriptional regulator
VDRAISVLEILAQRGEAGVSEVAGEIEVHKSTAFRLLGALEARGLVEQAGERGKYRLGFGIVRLAGAVTGRIDITQQGRPVCERLAEEIGETVNIAVMQEQYAINLYEVRGPGAVTAHNWVGRTHPVARHLQRQGPAGPPARQGARRAAGGGRPEEGDPAHHHLEVEAGEEPRRGPGARIRLDAGGVGGRLHAMAAPVRDRDGEVIAAVSASGPAYRFTEERLHELAPVLVKGAEEISHRMGYLG